MSTETDRELLELAAKAAEIKLNIGQGSKEEGSWIWPINVDTGKDWDPLTDDGDALRLAVKLGISIDTRGNAVCVISQDGAHVALESAKGNEALPITRSAIVRAAAAIGKAMP